MTPEDRRFLSLTFDLAARGLGRTSPNPAVGAVVVRDGEIVGTGYHARAGEDHAEAAALGVAGDRARGAVLYVNLEPCCVHRLLEGRAPSCAELVVSAGIRRVVAATRDPNPRIDGRGLAYLRERGVEIEEEDPCLARRAAALNEVFFHSVRTGRPFVVLKAGMTLDGRIALADGASKWITGEEARAEARALREQFDAVLIGSGTALVDDPLLLPEGSGERCGEARGEAPRAPLRVVLDSRLRLSPTSRLAASVARGAVLVYAGHGGDSRRRAALESAGVQVVRCGEQTVDLSSVLSDLGARLVRSVLVEGGSEIHGAFLRAGLVDKVVLFAEPALMGGRDSLPAFGSAAAPSLSLLTRLERMEVRRAGSTLVIAGYPVGGSRAGLEGDEAPGARTAR